MELLKHELFKLFMQKSVIITFTLFVVFLGVAFSIDFDPDKRNKVSSIQQSMIGPITEEKVKEASDKLQQIKDAHADEVDFNIYDEDVLSETEIEQVNVYDDLIRMGQYMVGNQNLSPEQVKVDLDKLTPEDGYTYKEKKLHYDMISNVPKPSYEDNSSWSIYIMNFRTLGTVVILVLTLLGLSPMFAQEYSTGMANFILSSKNGRKIVTAKLGASIIFITIVHIAVVLALGVAFYLFVGSNGGTTNLQSLFPFLFSPFEMQLWQYAIYQFLACLAGTIAFGMVILLSSIVTRSPLITFFIGIVVFEAPVIINQFFGEKFDWIQTILSFSYGKFVIEELIIDFKAFNIFGLPVLYPYVAFVVLFATTVSIIWLSYNRFKSQDVS